MASRPRYPTGTCRTALASPQARESCHHDSRHCPCVRCARAMPCPSCRVSSVITMCMVRTPKQRLSPEGRLCRDCPFLDAIDAVPRLPSPECDGRIKVRLRFLVSFDLHFEVLQVARHTVGPHDLHCRWIAEQATALKIWLVRRW